MRDPLLWILASIATLVIGTAVGYFIYLFVTVIFMEGGSACPQNLCQP